MPDLIRALQGDLSTRIDSITEDSEGLLQNIDLKDLLENIDSPEELQALTFAFIENYIREIEDAIGRGQRFADTVIENGRKNGNQT